MSGDLVRPATGTVVLGTVSSDSHTWNLVFLQLLLEEMGRHVINLGACVPDEVFIEQCRRHRPDLVVVSSVNGHGYAEGRRLGAALRAEPALHGVPVVIGGKLGVSGALDPVQVGHLLDAGFNAVYTDGAEPPQQFLDFVHRLDLVGAA